MQHGFSNLALPVLCSLETVGVGLVVEQSLGHLLLGGQDKWAVLDDGLVERGASNKSQSRRLGRVRVNLEVDDVALGLKDDVVELLNDSALVILSNNHVALEGVGKGVPVLGKRLGDLSARADLNVEDPDGGVGEVLDGVDAVALAGDDLDGHSVVVDLGDGDLGGAEITVARLAGLEVAGQIDPQLETDVGVKVLGGHLAVDDSLASSHELKVTGMDGALVTGEIFMVNAALEEIGDGLLASVGTLGVLVMRREVGGNGGTHTDQGNQRRV